MRILVTGATGFLGGVTAHELARRGHTVTGLGRDMEKSVALEAGGIEFVRADLRNPADWLPALDAADAVLHAAARSTLWGQWQDFVADNIVVSREIARACAERGLRLVHISTPSVYNATGLSRRVPESAPIGPRFDSPYARSKYLAELEVTAIHPEATLLRPRGIYGIGDTSIIPRLSRALRSGRLPRLVRGEVHTELTHVRNVAHAARLALEGVAPGIYNVTDGVAVPIWATLDALADALGVARPARYIPARLVENAARIMELAAHLHPAQPEPTLTASGVRLLTRPMTLDLTRARERLGYSPVIHPREGLAEVLAAARP
ncbi:NAD-dependent epimerase/dehydratase family protein [Deinococcus arenicola]|uniref:NAD-dependent epimerase/dehydratase family protein n=1 Tax=Deinococcus arenicola TaxID=2994950 RepID=A0ABU4DS10_9DEIO|nr:NAD-dependent epimerase/dehydratase family protein [Deinococcus sp. ZS9-10]MDV6375213.1 NAD-dependent epimerase/dehydratase family protein [Deinococcus sp. ZS9-10]